MTADEASALRPGDTIRWTPNTRAQPIDGTVIDVLPEGVIIEWDDGYTAAISPGRLTFITFEQIAQKRDEESP
jgi:hypothetical protein